MIFRKILKEDIETCSELFAQVFSSAPWNEPWDINSAHERLLHFYQSKGFIGIVAEHNGIAGFALGNTEPFHFGSLFYLREMCTHTNLQSKGIGSDILHALEQELSLNKVNSIYLTTEREIPAADFYTKKGFKYSDKMGFYAKRTNV